jgi:hypothetical protein
MKQVALLLAFMAFILTPAASAKTIELDAATIADINAAYAAGTLTAEKLVQLCLARIDAYDKQGPSLHAVITVNPKALEIARALDAERKAKGPRSPLHGIPIVLKDNYDTADLPTTGGSLLLEGWIPPDDAFVVKKLRDAGAIIIAKLNMSEFASGAARSSLGGAALNPHDPSRTPSGSSGRDWCRHRRGLRDRRHGHRYRRLDPRTVNLKWHRRLETDAWPVEPRRHHSAGAVVRYRRPDGAAALPTSPCPSDHDRSRPGRRGNEEKRRQV